MVGITQAMSDVVRHLGVSTSNASTSGDTKQFVHQVSNVKYFKSCLFQLILKSDFSVFVDFNQASIVDADFYYRFM